MKTPFPEFRMRRQGCRRQRGAALFISLMFLIILTLIGISAANVSVLQERMAGNVRDTNVAFQAAEAALRGIEQRVREISTGTSGGLPVIPIWSEVQADLDITRSDCTLSGRAIEDWPWSGSPDITPGVDEYEALEEVEYVIAELSGSDPTGGVFGSACRPMQGESSGNPGQIAVYYLIAARGETRTGTEAVVQSIFFWP